MTTAEPARGGEEAQQGATDQSPAAWADYLAAARRLAEVRRAATTVASEQVEARQAAGQELMGVRARLAPQHSRLVHDLGVPESALIPTEADLAQAAQAISGGPGAVLAALRQARGLADEADAAMLGPRSAGAWRPWARNLLVYGPFAVVVLIVQIVLYLVAPSGSVPTYALVCGLTMPVLAFGLGWVTIGFVYGPGKVDRTPLIGAIACLTPVLLTCMGVGVTALFH